MEVLLAAAPDRPAPGHAEHAEPLEPLDLPDLWGHGSFPASNPPANW